MSQLKQWLERNGKRLLRDIIVLSIPPFIITLIAIFYGVFVVFHTDAMKALIEAEATILGFFGLIIIYVLTSLDKEHGRYEQQLFDLTEEGKHTEVPEAWKYFKSVGLIKEEKTKGQLLMEEIYSADMRKRITVRFGLAIGISLVTSILLSILSLALSDLLPLPAGLLSVMAVSIFLMGVVSMLLMFKDIAKSVEYLEIYAKYLKKQ